MALSPTTTRTTAIGLGLSANQTECDVTVEDLLQAWHDCRKRKSNSASAIAFGAHLARNIMQLHAELHDGTYAPGRSICFVVLKPKPREVWAADFRDRVVHHLLYNRVAERFVRAFSTDSCACLPGRGTLYGARRLESKIRRVTENWTVPAHYLKCDFANFFVSIDRSILRAQLAAKIHEPWWLWLADVVLFHDPRADVEVRSSPELMARVPPYKSLFNQRAGFGLPIGNLSSQFFANIYLDALDQFAQHEIRSMGYVRYVDDFILLERDPARLVAALARIEAFAQERLGLRLNPTKTILQPVDRGVDFVGHIVRPHHTRTRKRLLGNALRSLEREPDAAQRRSVANSYLGLMRQGKDFHRRAQLVKACRLLGHSHESHAERVFLK
ncbi:Reverse transcriptase (RNA-dependent DNA polymerase) [Polaromonas sp. OV174]|nr:Reverse transcriptase (RNA-dependent DNA polymerase) [Polaromonas sp. OV174]